MTYTNHANKRCKQRGLSHSVVDLIVKEGDYSIKPGGVYEVRLKPRKVNEIVRYLKKQIQLVERSRGKAIIVSDEQVVVTAYQIKNN